MNKDEILKLFIETENEMAVIAVIEDTDDILIRGKELDVTLSMYDGTFEITKVPESEKKHYNFK